MIKNIVVALDGSDHARHATDLAGEVAQKFGARLHLVHVIPHTKVPDGVKTYAEIEHVDSPECVESKMAEDAIVSPARKSLNENGIHDVRSTVLRGDPVGEVFDYAKRLNADIIFAGRRGLGGIEGVLRGSFSAKLNHLAECPVVTVK